MTKIWDTIWKWFQESAQNLVKNLPMIPIGWGVGITAAKEWLEKLRSAVPDRLHREQTEQLKERFPWLYQWAMDANRGASWFDGISKDKLNTIINDIKSWGIESALSKHKSTLETAGITSTVLLLDAYNKHIVENMKDFEKDLMKQVSEGNGIRTYGNENLKIETVKQFLESESWQNLLKDNEKIWINVETYEGTSFVVNKWSILAPKYELLTKQEYEEEYWKLNEEKLKEKFEEQLKDDKNLVIKMTEIGTMKKWMGK